MCLHIFYIHTHVYMYIYFIYIHKTPSQVSRTHFLLWEETEFHVRMVAEGKADTMEWKKMNIRLGVFVCGENRGNRLEIERTVWKVASSPGWMNSIPLEVVGNLKPPSRTQNLR